MQQPRSVEVIPTLHPGESEAISLARELRADLILIDERKAFHAALARGLTAAGTVRVLIRAAQRKLLNLERAFERLKRTDFWIDPKLLDRELDLFKREQSKNNSG